MNDIELKLIIEALLMSSHEPLSIEKIRSAFEGEAMPSAQEIHHAIAELARDYKERAIELKTLASGFSLQTKACYSPWIARLMAEKPVKYSRALLETLAIIAYKQPVSRAEIEEIRGVAVSSTIMKTLIEREWIRIAGHRDVPGKPAVYVTTKSFLDYFNLRTLNELPPLESGVLAHEQ